MSILLTSYKDSLGSLLPNPTAVDLDAPADVTKPFAPLAANEADRRVLAESTFGFLRSGDIDEATWDFMVEEARRIEVAVATLARIGEDLDALQGWAMACEAGCEVSVETIVEKAHRIGVRESSVRPGFAG